MKKEVFKEIFEKLEKLELMGYSRVEYPWEPVRRGDPTFELMMVEGRFDYYSPAEAECENCGHRGLEFRFFVKDKTKVYWADCRCPVCDWSFESWKISSHVLNVAKP